MDQGLPEKITCTDCGHYYITHNPQFPYGCRGLGFKSLKLPCVEVLVSSGVPCRFFLPKQKQA